MPRPFGKDRHPVKRAVRLPVNPLYILMQAEAEKTGEYVSRICNQVVRETIAEYGTNYEMNQAASLYMNPPGAFMKIETHQIAFYFSEDEYKIFSEIAENNGINQTQLVTSFIFDYLINRGYSL